MNQLNGFEITIIVLETKNIDLPLIIQREIESNYEYITLDIYDDEENDVSVWMFEGELSKTLKEFFMLELQKQKNNFFIKTMDIDNNKIINSIGDDSKEGLANLIFGLNFNNE